MTGTITVEAYEGRSAPDELLREVFVLWPAEDAEMRPDDPPYTYEEVEGLYRIDNDRKLRRRWIARDGDGALVAINDAMGFVETQTMYDWQAPVAAVRTALEAPR